jgi:soluble lytic murein transglycosylase-like protein
MTFTTSFGWIFLLSAAPLAWAADEAVRSSLEKQRKSIAAMEASVEKQRRSARQSLYVQPASSFFTLPPIAPMPASPRASLATADCPALPGEKVDALISAAATREKLRPDLLRGVMRQESGFRPCAVSPKGAMGLMQLMPATAAQFGAKDPFDAEQNIAAGAKFLKELVQRYGGDLSLALAAYNAGPERVDAAGGIPDIPETKDYVRKIVSELPPPKPQE